MIPKIGQRYRQGGNCKYFVGTVSQITRFVFLNCFDHRKKCKSWEGQSSDLQPSSNNNGIWNHMPGQEAE